MPEGPEVRKNTDFLNETLAGKTIISSKIISGRYTRHGAFKGYDLMSNKNLKITDVNCKGKFIYFNFYDGSSLWSTLGMTGVWQSKPTKHNRFLLETGDTTVYYNDTRNFGTLKYTQDQTDLQKKLKSIGPDFLKDGFGPDEFYRRIKKFGHKTIAQVLMDQKIVSGIGNYLKAECLYAAKISPHRYCTHITEKECEALFHACRRIIRLSYKMGGATLATYRQPNGEKGLYSRRFAVYNQNYDPNGFIVLKEKTLDNRTTHWVPIVQK